MGPPSSPDPFSSPPGAVGPAAVVVVAAVLWLLHEGLVRRFSGE